MKKIIALVLLNLFILNSFSQLGNVNIKKPKLEVTYPDAKVEIGKKKDKPVASDKPAEKEKKDNTNTSTSGSSSTPSTTSKGGTSSSPEVESKQTKYAKEEEYFIGLGKFIEPYQSFVTQFDWGNVTSPEQIELFKKMDYDIFTSKNNEVKVYEPIDRVEFYQNDNKYKPSNSFKAVDRFYERQYAALKNGGKSLDSDHPCIKEILMEVLADSYKYLKELKADNTAQYYNVDRNITSFEKAIPPLEYWTTTEFVNDNTVKADLADFKKQLANLKQIKATGADKAYVEKKEKEYKAESMAKVKISPAAMYNTAYEAKAKAKVEKLEQCVVKKVVITGKDWYVAKNDFGIPLDKSIPVEVAFTKDGKCYLLYGYMVRDYEGGGIYEADPYFSYSYGSWDEMFCENIK